jgi:hypothetical protein
MEVGEKYVVTKYFYGSFLSRVPAAQLSPAQQSEIVVEQQDWHTVPPHYVSYCTPTAYMLYRHIMLPFLTSFICQWRGVMSLQKVFETQVFLLPPPPPSPIQSFFRLIRRTSSLYDLRKITQNVQDFACEAKSYAQNRVYFDGSASPEEGNIYVKVVLPESCIHPHFPVSPQLPPSLTLSLPPPPQLVSLLFLP